MEKFLLKRQLIPKLEKVRAEHHRHMCDCDNRELIDSVDLPCWSLWVKPNSSPRLKIHQL